MSGIGNEPALGKTPWGTAEMKAALTGIAEGATDPTVKITDELQAQAVMEGKPVAELQAEAVTEEGKSAALPNGWVERTPYKYDQFTRDAGQDWDSNAKVYEWDGETGEVGPEYPELERELFGDPKDRVSHGIDFSK